MCRLCGSPDERATEQAKCDKIARDLWSLYRTYSGWSNGTVDPHDDRDDTRALARRVVIALVDDLME